MVGLPFLMDVDINLLPHGVIALIISVVLAVGIVLSDIETKKKNCLYRSKKHYGNRQSLTRSDDFMKETWRGNPETPWFK